MYEQTRSSASVWVYVPLAPGDRILAIWKRQRQNFNCDLALGFVIQSEEKGAAARRRFIVAGAEGTHRLSKLKWKLVDLPNGRESSFLFDSQPYGIRELMFSSCQPAERRSPIALQPVFPSPTTSPFEGFLRSSAPLYGVSAFRQCRRCIEGRWEVIGLLFMYDDGAISSVGHVRWDYLGDTMPVMYPDHLWLAFKRTAGSGCPYIAEARLSQAEDRSQWFQLSWHGRLEWWCSYRQCQIRSNGRTSIHTV